MTFWFTEEDTREKGKLYKPQSKLSEVVEKNSAAERAQEYARMLGEKRPEKPSKRRVTEKKKTNLELFKEELKMLVYEFKSLLCTYKTSLIRSIFKYVVGLGSSHPESELHLG